nr:nucleotide-binding alpha-beta plait domain-containing protein [Tanacetum cinerariifolium]
MRIATSILVSNLPDGFGARDLWNTCQPYGHVVDTYIPDRKTKAGKRFGFVRFIKIHEVDRFQRAPKSKLSSMAKDYGKTPINSERGMNSDGRK